MSDSVWPHRRQRNRLRRPWDSPGKITGVGCHFLLQCMKLKSESEVAQSCPTLSDPMDCSPPGSSVHGVLQARVLEWVAIAFSDVLSTTRVLHPEVSNSSCSNILFVNGVSDNSKGGVYHTKYNCFCQLHRKLSHSFISP